jgi:MFS family permease
MAKETGTRRWWALGAIILGVLAVVLDVTVLSVALPTLAIDLHASTSDFAVVHRRLRLGSGRGHGAGRAAG